MRVLVSALLAVAFALPVLAQPVSPLYGAALDAGASPADAAGLVTAAQGSGAAFEAKLTAAEGQPRDAFGFSVALFGDRALVGARSQGGSNANLGAAYVFVRTDTTWTQEARLEAADIEPGDLFGFSVALSGDRALVGAIGAGQPSVYVFVRSGTTWTEEATLTAGVLSFGWSVSISGDRALVGAIRANDSRGAVYVFVRSGTDWTQEARLIPADRQPNDLFGTSVALSGDRALVGKPGDDGAGVDSGSAYVFVRSGSTWTQEAELVASDAAAGDEFGSSVAIAGSRAIVGAPYDDAPAVDSGSAYVFVRSVAGWAQEARLVSTYTGLAFHHLGSAVSLSGDRALVGSRGDDGAGRNSGSAYIFVRAGETWSQEAYLVAPDGAAGDEFGLSVALAGERALVGAFEHDALGSNSGAGYVFVVAAPAPEPTYVVAAPDTGAVVLAGRRLTVRWSGLDVPTRTDSVTVTLRTAAGVVASADTRNTGRFKLTVPPDAPTGSDYTLTVARLADPSVFGTSGTFAVYQTGDRYVVTEPDAGESWARGTLYTVEWATPPNAPAGAPVTLTLTRASGLVVATFPGEPDDGALTYDIPADLTTGTFVWTIRSDADGAFFGQSPAFDIARFEVTAPAEGATWAAGTSVPVSWTTGANAAGIVRVGLRAVGSTATTVLANQVPYADLTTTVAVPPSVPAGSYLVQLYYRYTPPGSTEETRIFVYSSPITVTNPAAPAAVAARHFTPPAPADGSAETMVVVRGLADGAEVGVFAGDVLLTAGVMESGEAVVAVASDVVLPDGSEVWVGPSPALTVRALVDGREVEVGETAFVAGDVVVVTAAPSAARGAVADIGFALTGVMPNPTSGRTVVRFTVPTAQRVSVVVYDALGRAVATAFEGEAMAGVNEVSVEASSLPGGVYVARLLGAGGRDALRFTVVR